MAKKKADPKPSMKPSTFTGTGKNLVTIKSTDVESRKKRESTSRKTAKRAKTQAKKFKPRGGIDVNLPVANRGEAKAVRPVTDAEAKEAGKLGRKVPSKGKKQKPLKIGEGTGASKIKGTKQHFLAGIEKKMRAADVGTTIYMSDPRFLNDPEMRRILNLPADVGKEIKPTKEQVKQAKAEGRKLRKVYKGFTLSNKQIEEAYNQGMKSGDKLMDAVAKQRQHDRTVAGMQSDELRKRKGSSITQGGLPQTKRTKKRGTLADLGKKSTELKQLNQAVASGQLKGQKLTGAKRRIATLKKQIDEEREARQKESETRKRADKAPSRPKHPESGRGRTVDTTKPSGRKTTGVRSDTRKAARAPQAKRQKQKRNRAKIEKTKAAKKTKAKEASARRKGDIKQVGGKEVVVRPTTKTEISDIRKEVSAAGGSKKTTKKKTPAPKKKTKAQLAAEKEAFQQAIRETEEMQKKGTLKSYAKKTQKKASAKKKKTTAKAAGPLSKGMGKPKRKLGTKPKKPTKRGVQSVRGKSPQLKKTQTASKKLADLIGSFMSQRSKKVGKAVSAVSKVVKKTKAKPKTKTTKKAPKKKK